MFRHGVGIGRFQRVMVEMFLTRNQDRYRLDERLSTTEDTEEKQRSLLLISSVSSVVNNLSQNSGRRFPESRVRGISEIHASRDSQPADYRFEDFRSTPESSARRSNYHKAQSRPILAECRCARRPRTSESNASRCERTSHGFRRD